MKKTLFAIVLTTLSLVAAGAVQLAKPFGNGMVLQRGRPVPVWGTASAGATINVAFAGQTKSATADGNGAWRVTLDAMEASAEGRTLSVTGDGTVNLQDVLVGEVWLASGQSNMEFALTSSQPRWRDDLGPIVAQVTSREKIRYLAASGSTWEKFTPANLAQGGKSAIAVYFAMEIEQAVNVPVGIVVAAVGGTLVEEWYIGGQRHNQLVKALGPMSMRGVIWYQGEGNFNNLRTDDPPFGEKLRRLHGEWSTQFENPQLRFDYVQLAPHTHDYGAKCVNLPAFMESMGTFAADDQRASMTIISDLGCHADIHPRHKLVVAKRLALHALKRDYGFTDIKADSPKPISATAASDGKVTIAFNNVQALNIYHDERTYDPNVELRDGVGVWHPATIQNLPSRSWQNLGLIGGSELVVAASGVTNPTAVRHLYQEPYQGCLYNEVNLPVGPFCMELGGGANGGNTNTAHYTCEWIESTGEQCINTGIVPGPDTSLEIDFYTFDFVGEAILFGTGAFNQHEFLFNLRSEMGSQNFCWFGDYKWMPYLANRHLRLKVDPAAGKLILFDGETGEQLEQIVSSDFQCKSNSPLRIFGQSNGQYSGKYRIYSFKIVKNGTVVRDFEPAYGIAEQRYGLYDKVSGAFFGANGLKGGERTDTTAAAHGTLRFDVPAGITYGLNGVMISGNLAVVKNGAGTLEFSSTNSYSGSTIINAGKLQPAR